MLLAKSLDLDVYTRRQIELHQGAPRLRRRREAVDQPLVRAELELLTRLLVHVRRAEHGPLVLCRRERNRAGQPGTGALGGIDDLAGRLIENARVVRLQTDSNLV